MPYTLNPDGSVGGANGGAYDPTEAIKNLYGGNTPSWWPNQATEKPKVEKAAVTIDHQVPGGSTSFDLNPNKDGVPGQISGVDGSGPGTGGPNGNWVYAHYDDGTPVEQPPVTEPPKANEPPPTMVGPEQKPPQNRNDTYKPFNPNDLDPHDAVGNLSKINQGFAADKGSMSDWDYVNSNSFKQWAPLLKNQFSQINDPTELTKQWNAIHGQATGDGAYAGSSVDLADFIYNRLAQMGRAPVDNSGATTADANGMYAGPKAMSGDLQQTGRTPQLAALNQQYLHEYNQFIRGGGTEEQWNSSSRHAWYQNKLNDLENGITDTSLLNNELRDQSALGNKTNTDVINQRLLALGKPTADYAKTIGHSGATTQAQNLLRSMGLDPANYLDQINQELAGEDALFDPNDPMGYKNVYSGQNIVNSIKNKYTQSAQRGANTKFGAGFENRAVGDGQLDTSVEGAISKQVSLAQAALDNAHKRGELSDQGYEIAKQRLQDRITATRSKLKGQGASLITALRGKLTDVGNQARTAAAGAQLGDNFSLSPYEDMLNSVLTGGLSSLSGDLEGMINPDELGINDIMGYGKNSQGITNGTSDLMGALIDRDKKRAISNGLGSQGAF